MAQWHDKTSIRTAVRGLPADDEQVDLLLSVAREGVTTWAPAFVVPDDTAEDDVADYCPDKCRLGQQMRVQELWDGFQTNNGGQDPEQIGLAGYIQRAPTMGIKIRTVLRPPSAVPDFA